MSERRETSREQLVYDAIAANENEVNGTPQPVMLSQLEGIVNAEADKEGQNVSLEDIRGDLEAMLASKRVYLYERVGGNYVGVEQREIALEDLEKNSLFVATSASL